MTTRGEHLVRADRGFATGGGRFARLVSPAFDRVLEEIDREFDSGGIEATLPDGSHRRIGFRAPGANAIVHIRSWMALVRLATSGSVGWYKAWTLGEWSSPDPVADLRIVLGQRRATGRHRPRQGPVPLDQRARSPSARQRAAQGAREHRRPLRPRQRFLFGLARRDDDLQLARVSLRRRQPRSRPSGARSRPCSTGWTSSPASACSRSAAAGAASRSRRRGAAPRSSG